MSIESQSPAHRVASKLADIDGHCPPVLLYGRSGGEIGEIERVLLRGWLGEEAISEEGDPVHVDLLHVTPVGKTSSIQLNQMREVSGSENDGSVPALRFLRTPPLTAKHKVVWIEPAHRMVDRAAHSLLKSLEEPEPYSRVLLTTDSLGSVLPTIRSRSICVACRTSVEGDSDPLDSWVPVGCEVLDPFRGQVIELMREVETAPIDAALMVSERWHEIAKEWAAASGAHDRVACAWVTELVGAYLLYRNASPELCQHTLVSHRRILGNVTPPLVFDDLAAQILRRGSGTNAERQSVL